MSAPTVVVPFRSGGKTRLPADIRVELSLAMLGDVLEVAAAYGRARVVTDDAAAALVADALDVAVIADPGGGQGAAVSAGLAGLDGPCIVLNADTPCVRASDLGALAVPAGLGAVGLVAAVDGTTNALSLPWPEVFSPLYGPGSAGQFRAHVRALGLVWHDLTLANVRDDVDTTENLSRLGRRAGPRTRALVRTIAVA